MTASPKCPLHAALQLLGDRWSLIVLRDIIFEQRRNYRALLKNSAEGIATNILSDRLKKLSAAGLLTRAQNADDQNRVIYSLSEEAIQLLPVICELGLWGRNLVEPRAEMRLRLLLLVGGGAKLQHQIMEELRAIHLNGQDLTSQTTGLARLNQAVARNLAGQGPIDLEIALPDVRSTEP